MIQPNKPEKKDTPEIEFDMEVKKRKVDREPETLIHGTPGKPLPHPIPPPQDASEETETGNPLPPPLPILQNLEIETEIASTSPQSSGEETGEVQESLHQTPEKSPPCPQIKIEKGTMIYKFLGEEIRDAVIEEPVDWQKRRKEIIERMENEEEERRKKIEKAKKLQKSWELNNECRRLLKEYDRGWEEIEDKREKEKKEWEKKERIKKANSRKEEYKEKERRKEYDRKITEMLKSIPVVESEKIENTIRREENQELQEIKRNLWKKWRGKTKIMEKKTKIPKEMEKIDKRLQEIEKRIMEYKERKEKQVQKSKEKRESWKKKHKMIVEDTWSMMRWITQYIEENKYKWEKEEKGRWRPWRKRVKGAKEWMKMK